MVFALQLPDFFLNVGDFSANLDTLFDLDVPFNLWYDNLVVSLVAS